MIFSPNFVWNISHPKTNIFGKKILNLKSVLWFSLQILSETFLILRRIFSEKNIEPEKCVMIFSPNFVWNISHPKTNILGKKILSLKSVLWFSLQILSETSLILRRIRRDITVHVQTPPINNSCQNFIKHEFS